LEELDIQNEFHIGEGKLHEYWGTVNGNWFGGPNEDFIQILNDSYNFLYQFLDIDSTDIPGDLNNDDSIDVLDVIQVVSYILNGEYVEEADMNGDGVLNILDVIIYIDIILQ